MTLVAPPVTYNTAQLSAFYRTPDKTLHKLSAEIAIDPEGVTEVDVKLMHKEIMQHLASTKERFLEPIMVLVKGGKI